MKVCLTLKESAASDMLNTHSILTEQNEIIDHFFEVILLPLDDFAWKFLNWFFKGIAQVCPSFFGDTK